MYVKLRQPLKEAPPSSFIVNSGIVKSTQSQLLESHNLLELL